MTTFHARTPCLSVDVILWNRPAWTPPQLLRIERLAVRSRRSRQIVFGAAILVVFAPSPGNGRRGCHARVASVRPRKFDSSFMASSPLVRMMPAMHPQTLYLNLWSVRCSHSVSYCSRWLQPEATGDEISASSVTRPRQGCWILLASCRKPDSGENRPL